MAIKGTLEVCPYDRTFFKTVFVPKGKKIVWITQTNELHEEHCTGYDFIDEVKSPLELPKR